MHRYLIGVILFCTLLFLAIQSRADTIYLKNGNQIDGIITRETDEFIYIQMPLGSISLSKSAIESIQRSPVEDAEKTKKQWEMERKKGERDEAKRTRFEERQRARGLVKYKGTWMTPEKLANLKEKESDVTTRESLEKELEELSKEVESLKSENTELKEEIAMLKSQLDEQSKEQLRLTREMVEKQKETLEFQKEAEKRAIGQRPPHIWVAPKIEGFTRYPTPSE